MHEAINLGVNKSNFQRLLYLSGFQVAGADELPAEGVLVLQHPAAQQLRKDIKWIAVDDRLVRHLQ